MFNIPIKKRAGVKEMRFAVLKSEYRNSNQHRNRIDGKMFIVLNNSAFGINKYSEVMCIIDSDNVIDYNFNLMVLRSDMLELVEGKWNDDPAFKNLENMPRIRIHAVSNWMRREFKKDPRFRNSRLPKIIDELIE